LKNIKKEEPVKETEEIETLDLQETDDNYFSFTGLKKISENSLSDSIEKIRAVVNEIKELGFKIKNDELDLENKHRFIIEIEKDNK